MTPFFQSDSLKFSYFNFIKEWEENPLICVKSSGSTGDAKEIFISKEQMILSASKTIDFFNLKPKTKALLCLSMETIAGKMMLVRSIVGKWNLTISEPNANPLKEMNEEFDFAAFVPLQIQNILDENPDKLKKINTIIVGGAPISDELAEKLKMNEITVYQTFGMTETVSHIALRKIGNDSEKQYTTLKGITVSENEGELIVNYPEMFEKNLETNDLVKICAPNKFEWLGRADFIINSGGIKLNPEQIENKLSRILNLSFFLVGLPDHSLGTKLALILEENEDFSISKKQLQQVLDKYEIPKVYAVVNSFNRTESGKINRRQTLKNIDSTNWKTIH